MANIVAMTKIEESMTTRRHSEVVAVRPAIGVGVEAPAAAVVQWGATAPPRATREQSILHQGGGRSFPVVPLGGTRHLRVVAGGTKTAELRSARGTTFVVVVAADEKKKDRAVEVAEVEAEIRQS